MASLPQAFKADDYVAVVLNLNDRADTEHQTVGHLAEHTDRMSGITQLPLFGLKSGTASPG